MIDPRSSQQPTESWHASQRSAALLRLRFYVRLALGFLSRRQQLKRPTNNPATGPAKLTDCQIPPTSPTTPHADKDCEVVCVQRTHWAEKSARSAQFTGKDTEMPARFLTVVGVAFIALGLATQVSAEVLCDAVNSVVRDIKRRNCWPEPFVHADRATVRALFCVMVANGWRRQNMLGEFHFETATGQLTEAGRLKVRWILTECPEEHRLIYVHVAERDEETSARIAAVQQFAAQIAQ